MLENERPLQQYNYRSEFLKISVNYAKPKSLALSIQKIVKSKITKSDVAVDERKTVTIRF